MLSFVDFISVASALLGFAGFLVDRVPSSSSGAVQLVVGLDNAQNPITGGEANNGKGGNVPRIFFYRGDGKEVGYNGNGGYISTNEYKTIQVKDGSQWVEYTHLVASGNDAVCLSTVGVKTGDGRESVLLGNVFNYCSRSWAWAGQSVIRNNARYHLRCGWLDGDNTPGNAPRDIMFPLGAWGSSGSAASKNVCNDAIKFNAGDSPRPFKREKKNNKYRNGKVAIVTDSLGIDAEETCLSNTYYGEDIINLATGYACVDGAKKLIKLNNEDKVTSYASSSSTNSVIDLQKAYGWTEVKYVNDTLMDEAGKRKQSGATFIDYRF
ncbi:hypothetical protein BJ944DRAFT_242042 [Cunninghamella echinulata]|nr:hypothetical protein BJ944DRAFT_242042 [Cunninghamella echinulata]